jgi:predicted dehydrogenase
MLTPENRALGRRNFLRVLAGTPAMGALAAPVAAQTLRAGPLRLGFVGVGGQGRALLGRVNSEAGRVVALADINPQSLRQADEVLARRGQPTAAHYVELADLLEHEDVEAVIVAVPLWAHADVVTRCLDAGKHVLCEKMMAWDVAGCERMLRAARRAGRILEIGYQRHYSPIYRAAYEGVIKRRLLGDVYHVRLAWHRNGSWRRAGAPPSPDYDPSPWGYPTFEHLRNWRLYFRYSRGLFAELGSHQLNAANWFVDEAPASVLASGGVRRFKGGRESYDHVYAMWDYPSGLTTTFTSIESNAFDERYEAFFGTKATLIMHNETDALLFDENGGASTEIDVAAALDRPTAEASETKPANAGGAIRAQAGARPDGAERASATEIEISSFCAAVRTGAPVACGPQRAFESARACIAADQAVAAGCRVMME